MAPTLPALPGRRTRLRWFQRLLLLAGGPAVVLGALEAALRLGGYGEARSLFIPDNQPGIYRTNPAFTRPYFPAAFDLAPLDFRIAARKPPGRVRIFVLGESAARGVPEPAFGFAPLLRAELRAAYPGREVEVYDLGIVAINSHGVLETARAAAAFAPDLFVVYAGNNEVVGPFGPGSAHLAAMPPLAVIRAALWVQRTRTGQLLSHLLRSKAAAPPEWHGMASFEDHTVAGDDPQLAAVYRNFERNLQDIAAVGRDCGAKVIHATGAANLRDCPPFASRHRPSLPSADLAVWQHHFDLGRAAWECGDWATAESALRQANRLDAQAADGRYLLGQVLDHRRQWAQARAELGAALHWDASRFRPDAEINRTIRAVAEQHPGEIQLVDVAVALGGDPAAGTGPCAGREHLWEHVHFNWAGNCEIARQLAEPAGQWLFGRPTAPWPDRAALARAVGYTPFGELRVLRALGPIISHPPFTHQLTFPADQVRFQRAAAAAQAAAEAPGAADQARAQVTAAIRADPTEPELPLRLAEIEFESGHPAAALAALDAALTLAPPSAPLRIRRGRTLLSLGKFDAAEAEDRAALDLDPDHLPAYTELEAATRATRHFGATEAVLNRALNRAPGSDYLRLTLADLWLDEGRRADAISACQAVLRSHPANSEALSRLVGLERAAGRGEAAVRVMTTALETQPGNFGNALALAEVFRDRRDAAGLARCLLLATAEGPASAELHLYLAHLWAMQGEAGRARLERARAWRTAALAGQTDLAARLAGEFPDAPL